MSKEKENQKTVWRTIQAISKWTTLQGQILIPSKLVNDSINPLLIENSYITLQESSYVEGMHYLSLDSFTNGENMYMMSNCGLNVLIEIAKIFDFIEEDEETRVKYIDLLEPLEEIINELNSIGYEVKVKKEWNMQFEDKNGYAKKVKSKLDDILLEIPKDLAILSERSKIKSKKENLSKEEEVFLKVDKLLKD